MNDFLLENLAYLCKEGYTLQDGIDILYQLTKEKTLLKIQQHLNEGYDFNQLILQFVKDPLWKEYYFFFVESMSIEKAILQSHQIILQKNTYIKGIKNKLTYPLMLFLFILFFTLFLIYFIFPQFQILYQEFDLELSYLNQIILTLIELIPFFLLILFIGISVLIYSVIFIVKHKHFNRLNDLLKMKFINTYLKMYYSIKFAIYFNELVKQKIDTYHIFSLMSITLKKSDLEFIIVEVEKSLKEGNSLLETIQKNDYFDQDFKLCFQLMYYQNKPRALDMYLSMTLNKLENRIDFIIKATTTFVYLYTGVFALTIYLSLILPMINMIDQF